MSIRLNLFALLLILGVSSNAWSGNSNDSFSAEMSHVAGIAAISGITTYVADKYQPEHRVAIGFWTGTTLAILGEAYDSQNGSEFSVLDVFVSVIGAAAGSLVTDQYILMPVVQNTQQGAYVGVSAKVDF